MWILILVLVAPSASGGSSIASVPGFATEQSCVSAGDFWTDRMNAVNTWSKAKAFCVRQ